MLATIFGNFLHNLVQNTLTIITHQYETLCECTARVPIHFQRAHWQGFQWPTDRLQNHFRHWPWPPCTIDQHYTTIT